MVIEFHKFMEQKENKNVNEVINKITKYSNCTLKKLKTVIY
jgi:hypothetical protein